MSGTRAPLRHCAVCQERIDSATHLCHLLTISWIELAGATLAGPSCADISETTTGTPAYIREDVRWWRARRRGLVPDSRGGAPVTIAITIIAIVLAAVWAVLCTQACADRNGGDRE